MPRQVFLDYSKGKVKLEEVPYPKLRPDGVIVKTLYSAVSIGTERLMLKLAKRSLLGMAVERPDLLKLFIEYAKNEGFLNAYRAAMARLREPVPLGYSSSGVVLEVGYNALNEFKQGDLVACGGHGYASHAEITYIPRTLCTRIPEGVDPRDASFANIGAIAIHSLRLAKAELGANIAIIGLGLLGLIAVQLAKASGANVLGIDVVRSKIELAKNLGANAVALPGHDDIDIITQNFTDNKGFDSAIIFASTKSSKPLEIAAKIVRRKGRIVVPGWVKTHIPRNLFYEKELEFVIPRSSGLGIYDPLYETGKTQYLLEYIRWTAKENMKTFLYLLKENKINMKPLITHEFNINEAEKVYEKLYKNKIKDAIGIVFQYPSTKELDNTKKELIIEIKPRKQQTPEKTQIRKEKTRIGFIGAGQHAQGVLLPILKKMKQVELTGVATTTPAKATQVAKRWGFKYATTHPDKIIEDPDTDAVFIVTRHDTHAYYTVKALEAGKYVFVEKPLAITLEQLEQVKKAIEKHPGKLMVGFNRRYAPFTQEAKKILEKRTEPATILMRINAGYTPQDHWIYDPKQGGGRIISETCHFIDLAIYLTEAKPINYTITLMGKTPRYHITDNHIITMKHQDGSISTIIYTSQGTRAYSRELIEIYIAENAISIYNFKKMIHTYKLKKKTRRLFSSDRGYELVLKGFVLSIRQGKHADPYTDITLYTSYTTIAINESLQNYMNHD